MNTDENTTAPPNANTYDEALQRSMVKHWLLSGKSVRQMAQNNPNIPPKKWTLWNSPPTWPCSRS